MTGITGFASEDRTMGTMKEKKKAHTRAHAQWAHKCMLEYARIFVFKLIHGVSASFLPDYPRLRDETLR